MKYFDIGEQDIWQCEACTKQNYIQNFDIHHLEGRIRKDANDIKYLMCLCRKCHEKVTLNKISKSEMQLIHNNFLSGNNLLNKRIEMTLDTNRQLASNVIDAIHRYIGSGFMTRDNTGKTVSQVIREWESVLKYDAQSTCERIAIMVFGGNLLHQVEKIKNLKFVNN